MSKKYCSSCGKECDLEVNYGPPQYERSEYWGMTETTYVGRDIDVVSHCCHDAIYTDEALTNQFDESTLDLIFDDLDYRADDLYLRSKG